MKLTPKFSITALRPFLGSVKDRNISLVASCGARNSIANAFARILWPAYAVLLVTGFWNVSAVHKGQPSAWKVVLGIKIAVVLVSGLAAWLHSRSKSRRGLAIWGSTAGLTSVAALVLGVFLAG